MSHKYFISTPEGKKLEIPGKVYVAALTVPNSVPELRDPDNMLIVHREFLIPSNKPLDTWIVTHAATGAAVSMSSNTRKGALENAQYRIDRLSHSQFSRAIDNAKAHLAAYEAQSVKREKFTDSPSGLTISVDIGEQSNTSGNPRYATIERRAP